MTAGCTRSAPRLNAPSYFANGVHQADAIRGLTRAFDRIVDLSVDPSALVSAENRLHSIIGSVYLEYERVLQGAGVATSRTS